MPTTKKKVVVAYSATVYVTVEDGEVVRAAVNVHASDASYMNLSVRWVADSPDDGEVVAQALFAADHHDWPAPPEGAPALEVMV